MHAVSSLGLFDQISSDGVFSGSHLALQESGLLCAHDPSAGAAIIEFSLCIPAKTGTGSLSQVPAYSIRCELRERRRSFPPVGVVAVLP